jgi:hypothetical protein
MLFALPAKSRTDRRSGSGTSDSKRELGGNLVTHIQDCPSTTLMSMWPQGRFKSHRTFDVDLQGRLVIRLRQQAEYGAELVDRINRELPANSAAERHEIFSSCLRMEG